MDRIGLIAAKEFTTLQKAYRAGVPVPTPAKRVDNMFTMRYLGEESKAPLLKDVTLNEPEILAKEAVMLVERLLDAHIVHGDLSEYNLLLWNDRLFIIDFPQAVDFSSNVTRHILIEEAKPLLLRDLRNLEHFFARYDVELDAENEYDRLCKKLEAN